MPVNIILVHDMLEAFRKENLTHRASEEVTIDALSCSDPGELRLWLADYSDRVDGMLFTNAILLDAMKKRGQLPDVPCELVQPSGGDLLKMTTMRAGGAYRGSLSRVLIDIGKGGHIFDDILQTQFRPMIPTNSTYRADLELPLASALLERYYNAWDSGAFDLIIMNHMDLLRQMRESSVNAWCLLPGVETVFSAAERMALAIIASQMRSRSPVVVLLSDRAGKITPKRLGEIAERFDTTHERCFEAVPKQEMLELFGFGIDRNILLGGGLISALYAEMRKAAGREIAIGWGIGVSVPHAHSMALRAYRESLFDLDSASYLVTEAGEMLGPFGIQTSAPVTNSTNYEHLRGAAKRAGVSSVTFTRLLAAMQKIGSDIVTSDELSHCLGVTRRSAARLLSSLAEHDAAELCEYPDDATRGRPAKRYRLKL